MSASYTAEVGAGTANSVTVQAKVKGASWDEGLIEAKDGSDRITFASIAVNSADTSEQTIALATAREGTNTFYIRRARLFAVRLDDSLSGYVSASSDGEVTKTSTSFQQKLTKSWDAGSGGDWLLLASAKAGENSTLRSVETRMQLDDTTTLAQQLREPQDTSDWLNFGCGAVETLSSGTRTVDIDYRTENSGYTARIRAARFVALPLE